MRRNEYLVEDKNQLQEVLDNINFCSISVIDNDKPYTIPMNFVYYNNFLYFHGAKVGKKGELFTNNKNICFSAVENYSYIKASYRTSSATSATQFFKSVYACGKLKIVDNFEEKQKALIALMNKYEPNGNYTPLTDSSYNKVIENIFIFKIEIENITGKFKLGQGMSEDAIKDIICGLEKENTPLASTTIEMIKKYALK